MVPAKTECSRPSRESTLVQDRAEQVNQREYNLQKNLRSRAGVPPRTEPTSQGLLTPPPEVPPAGAHFRYPWRQLISRELEVPMRHGLSGSRASFSWRLGGVRLLQDEGRKWWRLLEVGSGEANRAPEHCSATVLALQSPSSRWRRV